MSDYVLELIKQELLRENPLSALDDLPVGTYETLRECKHKIEQQAEEIQRLQNQWIPVTERLPEHNQLVLIWEGNGVHFGRWHKGINDWLFYSPTWPREITHWMPLPEPPQQEKGKND